LAAHAVENKLNSMCLSDYIRKQNIFCCYYNLL